MQEWQVMCVTVTAASVTWREAKYVPILKAGKLKLFRELKAVYWQKHKDIQMHSADRLYSL